jgi:hypothetical protein
VLRLKDIDKEKYLAIGERPHDVEVREAVGKVDWQNCSQLTCKEEIMASPQLQMALDAFKMMGEKMAQAGNDMKAMRATMEGMSAFPSAGETKCTPVNAGGVPAEWVAAAGAADDRVILYLHGGGYVMGSIATHREMVALSKASGARIGGRLSPGAEHPFPAAVDDATATYRWLLSQNIKPSVLWWLETQPEEGSPWRHSWRAMRNPSPGGWRVLAVGRHGRTGASMTTRAKASRGAKQGLLGMARSISVGKIKSRLQRRSMPICVDSLRCSFRLVILRPCWTATRIAEKPKWLASK